MGPKLDNNRSTRLQSLVARPGLSKYPRMQVCMHVEGTKSIYFCLSLKLGQLHLFLGTALALPESGLAHRWKMLTNTRSDDR